MNAKHQLAGITIVSSIASVAKHCVSAEAAAELAEVGQTSASDDTGRCHQKTVHARWPVSPEVHKVGVSGACIAGSVVCRG